MESVAFVATPVNPKLDTVSTPPSNPVLRLPMITPLLRRARSLLPVAFLAVLPVAATAQITVATSTTAPSENLLVSFTSNTNSGRAWRANTSADSDQWRDVGQIFVAPEDAILNSITVVTSSGTNAPARGVDFTLTLYSFGTGFSASDAQVLATWTGVTPDPGSAIPGGTYFTFEIPDTQLAAGVTYGFLLHFDEMADNRTIALRYNGGSNVAENTRHLTRINASDGTPGALVVGTSSLEFYVQATPVPEPASVAFLLGAAALVICGGRRPTRR